MTREWNRESRKSCCKKVAEGGRKGDGHKWKVIESSGYGSVESFKPRYSSCEKGVGEGAPIHLPPSTDSLTNCLDCSLTLFISKLVDRDNYYIIHWEVFR